MINESGEGFLASSQSSVVSVLSDVVKWVAFAAPVVYGPEWYDMLRLLGGTAAASA